MFKAIENDYLVSFDDSFSVKQTITTPPKDAPDKNKSKKKLKDAIEELRDLQRIFYAHDKYSLLLIFQAMDAAGKDSTIRAVMSGVNPAGCQVYSFKKPTPEELDHDFLWRTSKSLPERGRFGIFNRSYYEEVLVVRVHPEFLDYQKLPFIPDKNKIWKERFESISEHEKHLARNGTIILKFWLNVSLEEQKNRFLDRINEPRKNWKFSDRDVYERKFWKKYMNAYEEALRETSRPWAPWYAIPADNKPYMRYTVAKTIVENLKSLKLEYPTVSDDEQNKFGEMKKILEEE
ncbi:PPK2 family polyphosphate kinase [Bacteroidota bacterium]